MTQVEDKFEAWFEEWKKHTHKMSEKEIARAAFIRGHNESRAFELLAALESLVAADNCNYEAATMRYEGLFDAARAVIAKAK